MIARARQRGRPSNDIWPGFVDALANLLLVITFLLSLFMLAQFFLGQALSGRDEALERLRRQVGELTELLSLERQASADLRINVAELSASLQNANVARDELQTRLMDIETKLASAEKTGEDAAKGRSQARDEVALLNRQLAALRQQLASLQAALDASETKDKEAQATIAELGKRLNTALASKVEELAFYRSEFFGRLREVIGDNPDIKIVGDRFVFSSEVLFPSGSSVLNEAGQANILKVARALLDLSVRIPKEINWILRVDGHTDTVPISTSQFPSNWELSSARATSVIRFLVAQGVPPQRLAAAGFGEFQPIDASGGPEANRRNRRIELKLTER